MQTREQYGAAERLRALPARFKVTADAEGWPLVPGRYGRLEWRGAESATGQHRLYAYTDRPRMIARLRALAGLHPQQIGDTEAVFRLREDDAAALRAVADLLRLRQRRAPVPGAALRFGSGAAHRATSGRQEPRSLGEGAPGQARALTAEEAPRSGPQPGRTLAPALEPAEVPA